MPFPLTYAHVFNLILAAEKLIVATNYESRKSWCRDMPGSIDDARMQLITAAHICKLRMETDLIEKNVAKDCPDV
jgi:hypothetical protein